MHSAETRRSFAAAALTALLPLVACRTTPELNPEAPELASLSFEGNHTFARGELEGGLATETGSWWPFARKPRFDAATFQGDIDRIVTFYRARGYFDARVVDTEVKPHGKGVDVRVEIDEGQAFTTRTLIIDGTDDLVPLLKGEVAPAFPLHRGEIFTEKAYQATKAQLLARASEHAHVDAVVEGRAQVDRGAHAVDVTLHLQVGAHYTVGSFDVIGNHSISDERILREIDDLIHVGDDFRASKLEAARARLNDLGVFGNVQVNAGKPDPASGTLPVVVSVAEAPFRTLRAGGGVGIDVEHEEAHVSVGFTDRNFLGKLWRLDFDNSFALEWLPNIVEPEFGAAQPAFKSTAKLTLPGFFRPGFDLETSVQGQREVEIGYGDWAVRGRVAVPMKLSHALTFTASYNAELTFFDTGSGFNGLSLTPAALLQLGNPDHTGPYVLSYLEEGVTWDRRDDPVEPTFGAFAKLSVQEAGGPLFGTFSDIRILAEARGYLPLSKRNVLALRVRAGALFPYGGSSTPIDQRFFLGGLDSVRGYGSLRLSPMARVNTCGPQIAGRSLCDTPLDSIGIVDVPIGGNGMAEASLELRHRLSETFSAVAFADTGAVSQDPSISELGASQFALTPGLGLRIRTPVGPIRIDLAYLLVAPARPVTVVAQTFGAQATGNYPLPNTSAGAVDTCGWPLVPQTGWSGTAQAGGQSIPYAQPSACKSQALRSLALSVAIGEAF
jgi:translocation and assembly module TamA